MRITACCLFFGLALSTLVAQSGLFEDEIPHAEEPDGGFDPGSLDDAALDALIAGEDIDNLGDESRPPAGDPLWFREIILKAGGGYNDNVLQGPFVPQQSPFAVVSLETLFSRLPRPGKLDVYLYILAEQVQYTEAEDIDYERLTVAQGRVSGKLNESWTLGTTLQYMYTNQVFDVADAEQFETNATALELQQVEALPFLERSFGKGFYAKLETGARRLYFQDPKDDYAAYTGIARFGRNLSRKSKMEFHYTYAYHVYEQVEIRDASGIPLDDRLLRTGIHDFELYWKRKWGRDRRFQTRAKLNLKLLRDNGVGYRDYTRYSLLQDFSYEWRSWTFTGTAKYSYYDYKVQQADPAAADLYSRTSIKIGAGMKKSLSGNLSIFADYVYELSQSNRPEDEFDQNKITMGLERAF